MTQCLFVPLEGYFPKLRGKVNWKSHVVVSMEHRKAQLSCRRISQLIYAFEAKTNHWMQYLWYAFMVCMQSMVILWKYGVSDPEQYCPMFLHQTGDDLATVTRLYMSVYLQETLSLHILEQSVRIRRHESSLCKTLCLGYLDLMLIAFPQGKICELLNTFIFSNKTAHFPFSK